MQRNTVITLAGVLIVVIALAYWFALPQSALVPEPAAPASGTATEEVPGDNLTLGQGTSSALGSYLVAYNGMTLYAYAPDADGASKCAGACATAWPPYTVTSTANLVAEYPIAGTITTLTRADGSVQVAYEGHPLYFYAGDDASGDTKGEGLGGIWHVAKP